MRFFVIFGYGEIVPSVISKPMKTSLPKPGTTLKHDQINCKEQDINIPAMFSTELCPFICFVEILSSP